MFLAHDLPVAVEPIEDIAAISEVQIGSAGEGVRVPQEVFAIARIMQHVLGHRPTVNRQVVGNDASEREETHNRAETKPTTYVR